MNKEKVQAFLSAMWPALAATVVGSFIITKVLTKKKRY